MDKPLYLHPQAAPNEAVTLYKGPMSLDCDQTAVDATGAVILRWFPRSGLRLECDVAVPIDVERIKATIAGRVTDVLVTSVQENVYEGHYSGRSTGAVTCLETGTGDVLTSMGFQVLNFVDFVTLESKPETPFGFAPRVVDLRCADWRVRVTAVEGSAAVFKLLSEKGGYAFTHLGHLERADGSTFSAEDTEGVIDALIQLFSFARGEACSLPVRWGIGGDGAVAWQGWYSPVVDPWRGNAQTWFDERHGNLLAEIFPSVAAKLLDPHLRMPVKIALHWYRKCNSGEGGMEGAIVLGMMALDLLGALIVVDDKSMKESKYDDLSAANKLAKLLQPLEVKNSLFSSSIPIPASVPDVACEPVFRNISALQCRGYPGFSAWSRRVRSSGNRSRARPLRGSAARRGRSRP